jgi:hypothetical protein
LLVRGINKILDVFRCQEFRLLSHACPNKIIMVIRDDSEVESTSDYDLEGMSKLDCNYVEYVM